VKVVVLGAGVIGTATAWFLRVAGHEVTVLERQPVAGTETSFANGGQIAVSHAEPWANPSAPGKILRWIGQPDAPLLVRPRLDWHQWVWGVQFLVECLSSRNKRNMLRSLAISKYSGAALREVRAATGIAYDDLQRGILQLYTDREGFEDAVRAAELVRGYGIAREVKTPEQCVALEPALGVRRDWIVGGTYTATDESGDAYKFTRALAELGAERGIEFRYGVTVESIATADNAVRGVRAVNEAQRKEVLVADAYVVCLASYTPKLLDPIGVRTLIYPLKGYSATLPIVAPDCAPTISLTDDAKKLVFTRLGDRLRVAGTAELAGYDLGLDRVRCEAITRRAVEWFGDAVDAHRVEYWAGLRPATPSNVPYIGRTRYPNLYLNAGHGTLGWTMAAGSGKALAEIVSGRADDLEAALRQ
jgi:D-amino-acid dehydrogenase